jgi:preprotein translocase subunit SecE
MAKKQHQEDGPEDGASEPEEGARASSEPGEPNDDEARDSSAPDASELPSAAREGDSEEASEDERDVGEAAAANQLGIRRYVMAGYFAAGMLVAYILSRTFSAVWMTVSNREWFAQALPALAAVSDEAKSEYSGVVAAIIALVATVRIYRRPSARAWSDDVAGELAKCVWPNKREVTSYTTVVIVVSLLSTAYLALLDRFYAFVTNIVYGNGS